MGRAMKLKRFPLFNQNTQTKEGLQRAAALVPSDSQICFLGSVPPNEDICVFSLCKDRPIVNGTEKPYEPHEMVAIEFALLMEEMSVPQGYIFRAAIRTPVGLLFLFEIRQPSVIIAKA